MRKMLVGFAFFVIIAVAAYLRFHRPRGPVDIGYAGNRTVTLWSSSAQVRAPIAMLSYGDRLAILQHFDDQVEVRTDKGATGWINERDLISSEVWTQEKALDDRAAAMPVEAHGRTRVISNLHVDAGREAPRIRQLSKDVPIDLLVRQPMDVPVVNRGDEDEDSSSEPTPAKKEDWWLVRAYPAEGQAIAGWVLGRFVDLNVPSPLPDYASSAGMRIVAWFDLYHVKDASGNPRPEYLVLTTHGGEGQPCDFTSVRVYTWSLRRNQYETAFVDGNLCGKLPVTLTHGAAGEGEATFAFSDLSHGASENRMYRMHQTIVRRVREGEPKPRKRVHS
ncbi:MAG TPA: hypothetical protein VMH00_03095 [Candidatus Limnocylindrales bacterium]|nr:hypothetical protein [Candidatus Limnocylindrales bacterium]